MWQAQYHQEVNAEVEYAGGADHRLHQPDPGVGGGGGGEKRLPHPLSRGRGRGQELLQEDILHQVSSETELRLIGEIGPRFYAFT